MDTVVKALKWEKNENSDPNEQMSTVPLVELLKEQQWANELENQLMQLNTEVRES